MGLEGKTIARVADLGYNGLALVFTDGTAAQFQGTGYETDGCDVRQITKMDIIHLQALAENSRRNSRAYAEAARLRYERGEMGAFEKILYQEMQGLRNCVMRNIGRQAHIPIAKTKARRT